MQQEYISMSFRLLLNRSSIGEEVPLSSFPVVVGRSAEAAIRLCDRWVSRRHCELDVIDGELVIRDLGAKHGTYVNGRAVAEQQLHAGDEICVGLTRLTVVS
jgi:pSer/pThr/pTyr-binding forkhead associated (FHA) protein